MESSVFTGLLQNTAILLSFSLVYDNFWIENEERRNTTSKVLIGGIIGAIGIVLMLSPWTLVTGIVFDTRSVMLSISGLLFGPIPTFIAMLIAGAFRFYIGGSGALMGIAVIMTAGLTGMLWRQYRIEKFQTRPFAELLLLGITVHVIMVGCIILLPDYMRYETYSAIRIPLIFVYIPATILLGMLMLRQKNNWKNRKAQAILQEAERRFTAILESTNLITLVVDNKGVINYCNSSLLLKTNFQSGEVLGQDFFELFIPYESQAEFKELFVNRLFRKGIEGAVETPLKDKEGKIHIVSWNITILQNESGKPESIAAIGVDITEQRNFEQHLIEMNSLIKANNRKYKKVNKELELAKIKAEESERLKSAFLANMSHEIRTPMNGILGFADLLKKPDLTGEEQQEYIGIITKSGKRMLNIINDLVEISRLESGIVPMKYSSTNVNNQLLFLYNFFLPQAQEKGLELSITELLPTPHSIIRTDEDKLIGIFTNLIKNALKYTDKGSIEFGCKIVGNSFVFYVKDTGIGVPKDKISAIFDRFVQADMSLSSQYEGAGLGLAISAAYAKMLKGEITVDSTVGDGSVFQFTMPFQLAIEDLTTKKSVGKNIIKEDKEYKDLTVLIVEDDYTSMRFIELLVNKYTSKILKTDNGKDAIDLLAKHPEINLMLIDIKMPGMNGLDVTKKVRSTNNQLIIVAQTAYALTGDKEEALEAGCNDYLTKPVAQAELHRIIQTYFSAE